MPGSYPAPAPNRGQIVVYADADCGGASSQFFDNVPDLGPLSWNDKISSIAVVSGKWQCCKNAGFQFLMGPVLTPGVYRNLSQYGIDNDSISSIMCVS